MCGRYKFFDGKNSIIEKIIYEVKKQMDPALFDQISLFEVYPSQKTLVTLYNPLLKTLSFKVMTWGIHLNNKRVINLRIENLYKNSFTKNLSPCFILSSEYYEWDNTKTKHTFTTAQNLVCLVGCYNDKNEFAIITEDAQLPLSYIHSRVPYTCTFQDLDDIMQRKYPPSSQNRLSEKKDS